jgi:hypothetical protein
MEKLSSIIHKSALETYDLVEKNQKLILQLITMFLPKETSDFIINEKFEYNTYYSKSELEAMDIKNQAKTLKKKQKGKKKHNQPISLSNSINKSKVLFLMQYIPENVLNFILFFSYTSLHSILFCSFIIIFIFVTNLHYLLITLLLLIINTIGIIAFSNCPIHILEKKYRKKTTHNQHFLCNIIKKIYDDNVNNNYEDSIEKLITAVFAFFIKINLLILYKVFMRGLFNP